MLRGAGQISKAGVPSSEQNASGRRVGALFRMTPKGSVYECHVSGVLPATEANARNG